jgi:hypothetical protein
MPAVEKFRQALSDQHVDEAIVALIMEGYETITDKSKKEKRAAFFAQAVRRMDDLLDADLCHQIRDACACSKGGYRLKAVQKIAEDYESGTLEEKIQALRQAAHMGNPTLNEDGTITAQIGAEGGFPCPCPVFDRLELQEPVSVTYCYCCAGHFRFHYQIALNKKLVTKCVESSALESLGKRPCRFVYAIVE